MSVSFEVVTGDLLAQPVDVIVNTWNRNLLPWWLLRPHGVSGALKRRAGVAPFWELQRCGPLALGQAVLTGAGQLPHRGIIHVASITMWGSSSPTIIRRCVASALALAQDKGFESIAFPVLGSGSAGIAEQTALTAMCESLRVLTFAGSVRVVRYQK
ncbi:MAG: macro domain-containing protein [Chloroflexaceae bacterium]|jgi:O-acetyl-ADP-ribose deacetylase (regulator of RNase III)|nr:macro domain-containing protein [Chloroflexaceae bacterium]